MKITNKKIDIGIITIIPKEIEAIFNVFEINADKFTNLNRPLDYWETEIFSPISNKNLRVIITFLSGTAGNTESGITTAFFLRDWRPKLMCLVGIAAGVEGKVNIGDILIPDKIQDICVTVKTEDDELPRGDVEHRDSIINRMLKIRPLSADKLNDLISTGVQNLDQIKEIAITKGMEQYFPDKFSIHDGSILSSNSLLKDSGYFSDVRKTKDEKCQGGEMEAAGFARACEIEDVPWLIVRGISDFGDHKKDDSFQRLAAVNAALALRLLLVEVIDFQQLSNKPLGEKEESLFELNIAYDLMEAYKNKRWGHTVTIGTFLSRPLWLSGKYELRKKFGEIIEDAAAKAKRTEERAGALIDDLGWTSYKLADKESAIKYIEDGLRILTEIGNSYLISKGNRHLASIARSEGDFDEAYKYIKIAKDNSKKIIDEKLKNEMDASLLISEAKLLLATGDNQNAKIMLINAKLYFEKNKDHERAVKTYYLLGKICNELGQNEQAGEYFTCGYNIAERLGRKDEMFSNSFSLGLFCKENNNNKDALKWFKIAQTFAQELNHNSKIKEITKNIIELEDV